MLEKQKKLIPAVVWLFPKIFCRLERENETDSTMHFLMNFTGAWSGG